MATKILKDYTFKELSKKFNEIPCKFSEMQYYAHKADWSAVVGVGISDNATTIENLAIGDIRLYSKALTTTNWDEVLSPYGYGKWRRMVTGDYIYDKALFRYILRTSVESSRPNVRMYKHLVDVPDITDTKVVDIPLEQPLNISFSEGRIFHIVPDVNVLIKSFSGSSTIPTLTVYDITTKGFKVTLKNGSQFVAGKISYSATGY